MLHASAGPFFLGGRPSIADVGVFEVCDYFRDVFGTPLYDEGFAPFPRLRSLVAATKSLGRLAEHCDVVRTSYATWNAAERRHDGWQRYAQAVRETLS